VIAGAKPRYRRLAITLDTGAAIRGPARGDLYLGEGEAAGVEAGRVHHRLRLYRLVPK
jgi:membrane-bound lytic murein transglycosylase A